MHSSLLTELAAKRRCAKESDLFFFFLVDDAQWRVWQKVTEPLLTSDTGDISIFKSAGGSCRSMRVIGITGTLGAGKGAVVDYLVQSCGFKHFSVRAMLTKIIVERGLPVDRPSMVIVANGLREEHSPSYLVERLLDEASASGTDCIIESIRTPGEVAKLQQVGALLFAVNAAPPLRYERIVARASATDAVSFEQFIAAEQLEMDDAGDDTKQNLGACIAAADASFSNDGSLDELHAQVRAALERLGAGSSAPQ